MSLFIFKTMVKKASCAELLTAVQSYSELTETLQLVSITLQHMNKKQKQK